MAPGDWGSTGQEATAITSSARLCKDKLFSSAWQWAACMAGHLLVYETRLDLCSAEQCKLYLSQGGREQCLQPRKAQGFHMPGPLPSISVPSFASSCQILYDASRQHRMGQLSAGDLTVAFAYYRPKENYDSSLQRTSHIFTCSALIMHLPAKPEDARRVQRTVDQLLASHNAASRGWRHGCHP